MVQAGYPELAGGFKPIRNRAIFWININIHYKKMQLSKVQEINANYINVNCEC